MKLQEGDIVKLGEAHITLPRPNTKRVPYFTLFELVFPKQGSVWIDEQGYLFTFGNSTIVEIGPIVEMVAPKEATISVSLEQLREAVQETTAEDVAKMEEFETTLEKIFGQKYYRPTKKPEKPEEKKQE